MPHFTFIFSAMGGTKTRELLSVDWNFRVDCGLDSYVMKPFIDNRDGFDVIRSRDGGERKVDLVVYHNTNIFELVKERMPDIILVDEVQFMKKEHILDLKDIKNKLRIPVIAYGLKNDFQNEMFEGTKYTFLYADKFKQLKTVCRLCQNTATMNMRLLDGIPVFEGEQVELGVSTKESNKKKQNYLSVCSECYDKCKEKVEKGEF